MVAPVLSSALRVLGVASFTGLADRAIGASGWLNNKFTPQIRTSPISGLNGNISEYSADLYHFKTQVLAPSDADIEALDNFFESYGYAVNKFAKPNLKVEGREQFTYVKTRDAVVRADNFQAAQQMANLLNNGCKFWVGEIGEGEGGK